MEFSAVLFCLFFVVVGLMAIGAVKRSSTVRPEPVNLQRLRQQQALMEARRIQRERSQNWFKQGDENSARTTSFGQPRAAIALPPAPTPEAADGKQTNSPDGFNLARVDEAFNAFLRGRT